MFRFPAEWEPQDGIQFTFPHADSDWNSMLLHARETFRRCINAILPFEKVIVATRNVEETLAFLGDEHPSNLIMYAVDSNDTWARDHGGITLVSGGQNRVLDFTFNGWGNKFEAKKDNAITCRLDKAGAFAAPVVPIPFVLEGGSIETDGLGTLLSTSRCLLSPSRNPGYSREEIEEKLRQYLFVDRILWLNHGHLAGDDTDAHIDTLVRFCNPQTLAFMRCTNSLDIHYESFRNMEEELKDFRDAFGKPYNLVPLPWPDACYGADGHRLPATYANFLIINEAVILPVYGVAQDEEAIDVLCGLFPERKVIPVNCLTLIEQHGSLHCITMHFPKGTLN